MNNIKIIKRANVLGYCMGVKKAIDAVYRVVEKKEASSVYTFGPLIHNPATLSRLAYSGVKIIEPSSALEEVDYRGASIVIRAHGISPNRRALLEKSNANIVDATCPRVVSSQLRARKYAQKGYTVILAGDKNHGELIGIAGYVESVKEGACYIVQNKTEAESLTLNSEKAVLVAQTTISSTEYSIIAETLLKHMPHLVVLDTICPATQDRQDSLKELADEVECILVIGGKTSANTRRLLQTALLIPKPAWLVEKKEEVPAEIFQYTSVGIAAGASTPDFIIDEIESFLVTKK